MYPAGCVAIAAAILAASVPAQSRAPSNGELLAGCALRVAELEDELDALRQQLRALENAAPHAAAEGESAGTRSVPECAVPFQLSRVGIKRFKQQCLQALRSLTPCELPYEVDPRGVKNFKPSCL